jgi:hypothetical protein
MRTERKIEIAKNHQSPDGRRRDIEFFESGHTPYNKRTFEVHECNARLSVEDYDGSLERNPNPWTQITLSEYETYESGKSVSRNISMTLNADMRKTLINLLSREPQPLG